MVPRVPVVIVVAIIVLATVALVVRVSTAPERIQKRLDTAKAVCHQSGGQWVIDAERNLICKTD